jgi:hypothetical protein
MYTHAAAKCDARLVQLITRVFEGHARVPVRHLS